LADLCYIFAKLNKQYFYPRAR